MFESWPGGPHRETSAACNYRHGAGRVGSDLDALGREIRIIQVLVEFRGEGGSAQVIVFWAHVIRRLNKSDSVTRFVHNEAAECVLQRPIHTHTPDT